MHIPFNVEFKIFEEPKKHMNKYNIDVLKEIMKDAIKHMNYDVKLLDRYEIALSSANEKKQLRSYGFVNNNNRVVGAT